MDVLDEWICGLTEYLTENNQGIDSGYFKNKWLKFFQKKVKRPQLEDFVKVEKSDSPEITKRADYTRKDVKNLEDLIQELGETFHEMLFRKIDESGMSDAEVYKKANLDRKHFSKIRNNPAYHPRKGTILALAIALELDLEETVEFLGKAEYALSPGNKGDLIVRYFIEQGVYDINVINYALQEFKQPTLGS